MAVAGMCLRDGSKNVVGPMFMDGTCIVKRVRDVNRPQLPLSEHVDNIDSVGGAVYDPDDEGIEAELVAGVVE